MPESDAYLADLLVFAGKGNAVFPVRVNKRPYTEHGFKDATADTGMVRGWWRQFGHPLFAWALPEGQIAVDIDDPTSFAANNLELPATAMQPTRTDGHSHHIYRLTDGDTPPRQLSKPHPGMDFRVGGLGYLVLYDEMRGLLTEPALRADWMVAGGGLRQNGHPAPREVPEVLQLRDDILLALGKLAAAATGLTEVEYRHMLEGWRSGGRLVASDPRRPWEDEQLDQLAAQAEAWDREARVDGAAIRVMVAELNAKIQARKSGDQDEDALPEKWPEAPDPVVYHGLAGDIVTSIMDETEADPVGLLAGLLTIYGTMVGDAGSMHAGGWQHANLFTVQVGPTSAGRKGTTFGNLSEVMGKVERDWGKELMVAGLNSGEGLIRHLKQQPEGHTPRALIYESEFVRLLRVMSWEGNTLSPILRSAWDGVNLGRAVAAKAEVVMSHHVGLLANVTESEVREVFKSSDQANGFGNRFLWIATRRTKLLPKTRPLSPMLEDERLHMLAALQFGREYRTYEWEQDAEKRWNDFYREPEGWGMWGAMTRRRQPTVIRLCLAYTMLNREVRISLKTLEAAIALVNYSERTVAYLFGHSTGNRNADLLLGELRRGGEMDWYTASHGFLRIHKAPEMAEVVRVLRDAGLVTVRTVANNREKGGGRPSRWITAVEGTVH